MRAGAFARRITFILAAAIALPCATPSGVRAQEFVPGEVLVKFRPGRSDVLRATTRSWLDRSQRLRAFGRIGAELRRFDDRTTESALALLRADPAIAYAEPNWIVRACLTPNDPQLVNEIGLRNTGQGGGIVGADIDAILAWDLFTGDSTLRIGVIDTGVDYTHPDLAANIWTNPGEIPGNAIDDDGNGYTDDVHGYDVLNDDGDPMDDHYHGTHVAGTIGAVTNNALGIAGVNWRCRIVPIKFMNSAGYGTDADAIAAIEYAMALGLRVTNNSWGNMPYSQAMQDAIAAAGDTGQLLVFAAGNDHFDLDLYPVYPAAYDSPYILSVAATENHDARATFSNYGATTVDLGAPGWNTLSCKPGGLYQYLSGTSMAAPHVTGVAGLVLGRTPNVPPLRLKQLILDNAEPSAALEGYVLTGARLNAYQTLLHQDLAAPGPVTDLGAGDVGSTAAALHWTAPGDDGAAGTAARYDLRVANAPIDASNFAAAAPLATLAPRAAGTLESLEVAGLPAAAALHFAVRAFDDFENAGPVSNDLAVTTLGPPTLALAPAAVSALAPPGALADVDVLVSNAGAGRLDFGLDLAGAPAWLAVTPDTGRVASGASTALRVRLDATALAPGVYSASFGVRSNDAGGASAIPVTLTVSEATAIESGTPARFGLRVAGAWPGRALVDFELALAEDGEASLALYDVRGRLVRALRSGAAPAGRERIRWDGALANGAPAPSGIYFARARTAGGAFVARFAFVR